MATDPAHLADNLMRTAFAPHFGSRLPDYLGREVFNKIRKVLRAEGFVDDHHSEEVFSRTLLKALDFLKRHDGAAVRLPRAWVHTIARHETGHYLEERGQEDSQSIVALLEGEIELPGAHLNSEERILALVRRACDSLTPRLREFLLLDLLEALPPEEIRKRMGITSPGYFRVIKHEAFSALRAAIKSLVEKGVDALF